MAQGGSSGGESVENSVESLDLDELKEQKEIKEKELSDFETTFNTTKKALADKQTEEARKPLDDYNKKKDEWEKLDALAKGMNKELKEATAAFDIAQDAWMTAKATAEELDDLNLELDTAKKRLPIIAGAADRKTKADGEMTDLIAKCKDLKKKGVTRLKMEEKKAKDELAPIQTAYDKQKAIACTDNCDVKNAALEDIEKNKLRPLKEKLEEASKAVSFLEKCPENKLALSAEISDLNTILSNPNAMEEKNKEIEELDAKIKDPRYDNAAGNKKAADDELAKKQAAKVEAAKNAPNTPDQVQKAEEAAHDAEMELVLLKPDKTRYEDELKKLQKKVDEQQEEYNRKNAEVKKVTELYDAKNKKGEDPGTGSTTTIAIVAVVVILLGVVVAVGIFLLIRKRGKKKDDDKTTNGNPSSVDAASLASATPAASASAAPSDVAVATPSAAPGTPVAAGAAAAQSDTGVATAVTPGPPAAAGNAQAVQPLGKLAIELPANTPFMADHRNIEKLPYQKLIASKHIRADIIEMIKEHCFPGANVYKYSDTTICQTRDPRIMLRIFNNEFRSFIRDATKAIWLIYDLSDPLTYPVFPRHLKDMANPTPGTPHIGGEWTAFFDERARRTVEEWKKELAVTMTAMKAVAPQMKTKATGKKGTPRAGGGSDELYELIDKIERLLKILGWENLKDMKDDTFEIYLECREAIQNDPFNAPDISEVLEDAAENPEQDERPLVLAASPVVDAENSNDVESPLNLPALGDDQPREGGGKNDDSESSKKSTTKGTTTKQESKNGKDDKDSSSKKSGKSNDDTEALPEPEEKGGKKVSQKPILTDAQLQIFENKKGQPRTKVTPAVATDYLKKLYDSFLIDDANYAYPHTLDGVLDVLHHVKNILYAESMLIELEGVDCVVIGDLHGSADSFLAHKHFFSGIGSATWLEHRYVFLGDFVDRGTRSFDIAMIVLLAKIAYPDNVYLLRGNHESLAVNGVYGLQRECVSRYGQNAQMFYKSINYVFTYMSLACLAGKEGEYTFMSHGGIPVRKEDNPFKNIEDFKKTINAISKPLLDTNDNETASQLAWADPALIYKQRKNARGGPHIEFGLNAVRELHKIGIKLCVRAHQVMNNGHDWFAGNGLVCVFTAAIADVLKFLNHGSILIINKNFVCFFHTIIAQKPGFINFIRNIAPQERDAKVMEFATMFAHARNLESFHPAFKTGDQKAVEASPAAC